MRRPISIQSSASDIGHPSTPSIRPGAWRKVHTCFACGGIPGLRPWVRDLCEKSAGSFRPENRPGIRADDTGPQEQGMRNARDRRKRLRPGFVAAVNNERRRLHRLHEIASRFCSAEPPAWKTQSGFESGNHRRDSSFSFPGLFAKIGVDMSKEDEQRKASSKQPGRQLIWGGLGARCSMCGWTRIYQPGAKSHQLPSADRAKAIRSEYEIHKCEDSSADPQPPPVDSN
jgi:hypothetical protein